ncbi:MAG: glycosyltransferase [Clostridia bacterium]|nr:glycosyltransferase [Clostridia bacterium]
MNALILSTHTGGGHDAAAYAIEEALTERGVTCRVMDCVAFGGAWLSRCVCGTYVKWVQVAPRTFGTLYGGCKHVSTSRVKSPVYLFNAAYAHRMQKILEEFHPDMIICTHVFAGQSVTSLRRRGMYNGLLATVMTDYTIHPFVEDVESDLLFIHETAKAESEKLKTLAPDAIHCTGIPVSLKCTPCHDKRAAKQAVGLDPDRKEVLLVGGSMGSGNLPGMIGRILPALGKEGHLTVVCGSNVRAKEKAEERYGNDSRVTICGRIAPLTPRIAAADVLVSKSGGLTSTEAMTIGTPMVVSRPIAGCETENIRFMESKGMAAWARSDDELTDKVAELLQSETACRQMIAAQRRNIDPDAARRMAEILIERTAARGRKEPPDAREA